MVGVNGGRVVADPVGAREGPEIVVERVVLLEQDYDMLDGVGPVLGERRCERRLGSWQEY